jgi:hypothetical protein
LYAVFSGRFGEIVVFGSIFDPSSKGGPTGSMGNETQFKVSVPPSFAPANARKENSKPGKTKRRAVYTVLSTFGIFGGISALSVGLVLVVIQSVAISDRIFDRIGTILLIVAIPLILTGSIFLGKVDEWESSRPGRGPKRESA